MGKILGFNVTVVENVLLFIILCATVYLLYQQFTGENEHFNQKCISNGFYPTAERSGLMNREDYKKQMPKESKMYRNKPMTADGNTFRGPSNNTVILPNRNHFVGHTDLWPNDAAGREPYNQNGEVCAIDENWGEDN
jgi:hypothetical protein